MITTRIKLYINSPIITKTSNNKILYCEEKYSYYNFKTWVENEKPSKNKSIHFWAFKF